MLDPVSLFDGLGAGLFLKLFDPALLLRLAVCLKTAANALDFHDVDAADHGFYLLLDRDAVKDLFVADKVDELGANLGFDHGDLGPLGVPGCLLDDLVRKPRLLQPEPLFIDDQKRHGLFHGLDLRIGLCLPRLEALPEKVERDQDGDQDDKDNQ